MHQAMATGAMNETISVLTAWYLLVENTGFVFIMDFNPSHFFVSIYGATAESFALLYPGPMCITMSECHYNIRWIRQSRIVCERMDRISDDTLKLDSQFDQSNVCLSPREYE
jgi:hypothetical protein